MKKLRWFWHHFTLCLFSIPCALIMQCSIGETTFFHLFSYPPSSEPHTVNGETNWEYIGSIEFYFKGTYRDQSTKRLHINVENKSGKVLLDDSFELFGGNLEAEEIWEVFDTLIIIYFDYDEGDLPIVEESGMPDTSYS